MLTLSAALGYYGLFPADSYPDTHAHKATRAADQNWRRRIIACQVHLPFPDSRLTDAHIILYARRPLLLGDAGAFEVLEGEAVDAYYAALASRAACDGFPHLALSGPAELRAGATAACAVQMTNNQGEPLAGVDVYLEAHAGYLPRRKLALDPATGRAECPVTALGLAAGETIELKVGFRYYSNAASHVIRVVA